MDAVPLRKDDFRHIENGKTEQFVTVLEKNLSASVSAVKTSVFDLNVFWKSLKM